MTTVVLNPWQLNFQSTGAGSTYAATTVGPGTNYIVEKVEGLFDLPVLRTSELARANAVGVYPGRDLAGGKTLALTIGVKRTTTTLLANSIQSLLLALGPMRNNYHLVYNIPGLGTGAGWGDQRQIAFVPRKLAVNHELHGTGYAVIDMELFCFDPRAYSYDPAAADPTHHTRTVNMRTPGSVAVPNMGSAPAPFRLTVTAPNGCPAWTLKDVQRGSMIAQSAVMAPRRWSNMAVPTVTIDTGARTVSYKNNAGVVGNEPNLYKWITRWDLLEIPATYGANFSWSYTGANASYTNLPAALTVSLSYSDAWW